MPKIVYDEDRNRKEEKAEKKQRNIMIAVLSVLVIGIIGGLAFKAYWDNTHRPQPKAKEAVVEERHDLEYVHDEPNTEEPARERTPEESERLVLDFVMDDRVIDDKDEINDLLKDIKNASTDEDFMSKATAKMNDNQKKKLPAYLQLLNYVTYAKSFFDGADYNSDDIALHIAGIVEAAYKNEDYGDALFNVCSYDDVEYGPNDYIYYCAPYLMHCAREEFDADYSCNMMIGIMAGIMFDEYEKDAHPDLEINELPGVKAIEYVMNKDITEEWLDSLVPLVPISTSAYKYADGTTSSFILPVQSNSGMLIGVFDENENLIDVMDYQEEE